MSCNPHAPAGLARLDHNCSTLYCRYSFRANFSFPLAKPERDTALVLLRHKSRAWHGGLNARAQHGHRARRRATATVSLRRRVAIELGT